MNTRKNMNIGVLAIAVASTTIVFFQNCAQPPAGAGGGSSSAAPAQTGTGTGTSNTNGTGTNGNTGGASSWTSTNNTTNTNTTVVADSSAGGTGLPAGAIMPYAMTTCPNGWIAANGASIARAVYPNLFAAIGTMYGSADGASFNLPDYRGLFLRGTDGGRKVDPDRDARAARGDGTKGDQVGTTQGHQLYSHNHGASASDSGHSHGVNDGGHSHYIGGNPNGQGNSTDGGTTGWAGVNQGGLNIWTQPSGSNISIQTGYAQISVGIGNAGGNETRPSNITVLYCVKY